MKTKEPPWQAIEFLLISVILPYLVGFVLFTIAVTYTAIRRDAAEGAQTFLETLGIGLLGLLSLVVIAVACAAAMAGLSHLLLRWLGSSPAGYTTTLRVACYTFGSLSIISIPLSLQGSVFPWLICVLALVIYPLGLYATHEARPFRVIVAAVLPLAVPIAARILLEHLAPASGRALVLREVPLSFFFLLFGVLTIAYSTLNVQGLFDARSGDSPGRRSILLAQTRIGALVTGAYLLFAGLVMSVRPSSFAFLSAVVCLAVSLIPWHPDRLPTAWRREAVYFHTWFARLFYRSLGIAWIPVFMILTLGWGPVLIGSGLVLAAGGTFRWPWLDRVFDHEDLRSLCRGKTRPLLLCVGVLMCLAGIGVLAWELISFISAATPDA